LDIWTKTFENFAGMERTSGKKKLDFIVFVEIGWEIRPVIA